MATLEADSIWLSFSGRTILQNIYLRIDTGKVVGLLGRNGCGKSCLLDIIFGTIRGENQSVRVDGVFVNNPYQEQHLIRYLPQHSFVPPFLVVDQVFKIYKIDFEIVTSYFEQLNLYRYHTFGALSGGEQRLFEILLVVLSPVAFVLLDEPFSGLSPLWIEAIKKLIEEQKKYKGILISDHQYRQVLDLSDSIYLLQAGGSLYPLTNPETELRDRGYIR
jgi:ABC-type multidrug transport system ATPase subunit